MIAVLNGRVLESYSDSLVIGVGGVGLQVFVPGALRDRLRPGDEVFLHTYLVVRQDALSLYGFETREERELFLLLLSVDGIGPKLALAVLSTLVTGRHPAGDLSRTAGGFHSRPGSGEEDCPKNPAAIAGSHPRHQRFGGSVSHLGCRHRSIGRFNRPGI